MSHPSRTRTALLAFAVLGMSLFAGCTGSGGKVMTLDEVLLMFPWVPGDYEVEGTIAAVDVRPMENTTEIVVSLTPTSEDAETEAGTRIADHMQVFGEAGRDYNVGDVLRTTVTLRSTTFNGVPVIFSDQLPSLTEPLQQLDLDLSWAGAVDYGTLLRAPDTMADWSNWTTWFTRDITYGNDTVAVSLHRMPAPANATHLDGWADFFSTLRSSGAKYESGDTKDLFLVEELVWPGGSVAGANLVMQDIDGDGHFGVDDQFQVRSPSLGDGLSVRYLALRDRYSTHHTQTLTFSGFAKVPGWSSPHWPIARAPFVEGEAEEFNELQFWDILGEPIDAAKCTMKLTVGTEKMASARLHPGSGPIGNYTFDYHDIDVDQRLSQYDRLQIRGLPTKTPVTLVVEAELAQGNLVILRRAWFPEDGLDLAHTGPWTLVSVKNHAELAKFTTAQDYYANKFDQTMTVVVRASNGSVLMPATPVWPGLVGNWTENGVQAALWFNNEDDDNFVSDGDTFELLGRGSVTMELTMLYGYRNQTVPLRK